MQTLGRTIVVVLLVEVLVAAPSRAADPSFAKFGNVSFDCEQSGTNHVVRVDIGVDAYTTMITFFDNGTVRTAQIRNVIAIPQLTPDRFGNAKWSKELINVSWSDGGQYLSQLNYDTQTGRWIMAIDAPLPENNTIWDCLSNGPTAYECTPKNLGQGGKILCE